MGASISADANPTKWCEVLQHCDGASCAGSPDGSPTVGGKGPAAAAAAAAAEAAGEPAASAAAAAAAAGGVARDVTACVKAWCVHAHNGLGPKVVQCEGVSLAGDSPTPLDPKCCYVVLCLHNTAAASSAAAAAAATVNRGGPGSPLVLSTQGVLRDVFTPRGPNHPFSVEAMFPRSDGGSMPGNISPCVYVLSGRETLGVLKASALVHGMQLQSWLLEHPFLACGLFFAQVETAGVGGGRVVAAVRQQPPQASGRSLPGGSGSTTPHTHSLARQGQSAAPLGGGEGGMPHLLTSLLRIEAGFGGIANCGAIASVPPPRSSGGGGTLGSSFGKAPPDDAESQDDEAWNDSGRVPSGRDGALSATFGRSFGDTARLSNPAESERAPRYAWGSETVGRLVGASARGPGGPGAGVAAAPPPTAASLAPDDDCDSEDFEDEKVMERRAREKLLLWSPLCSTVLPHLCVGGESPAGNLETLLEAQITHVLNTVHMLLPCAFPDHFTYFAVNMMDSINEDISVIFPHAIACIEEVRRLSGKIMVHCQQGASRSCTLVLCYLMWVKQISHTKALEFLRERRGIAKPNMGFTARLSLWHKHLSNPPALSVYRLQPFSTNSTEVLVLALLSFTRDTTGDGDASATQLTSTGVETRNLFFDRSSCYLVLDRRGVLEDTAPAAAAAGGGGGGGGGSARGAGGGGGGAQQSPREPQATLWLGSQCHESCKEFARSRATDITRYSHTGEHRWPDSVAIVVCRHRHSRTPFLSLSLSFFFLPHPTTTALCTQEEDEGKESEHLSEVWSELGLGAPSSDADCELMRALREPLAAGCVPGGYWRTGPPADDQRRCRETDVLALRNVSSGGLGGATPRLISQKVEFAELFVEEGFGDWRIVNEYADQPFDDDDFDLFRDDQADAACVFIKHKLDYKVLDIWYGPDVPAPEEAEKREQAKRQTLSSFMEWVGTSEEVPDWLLAVPLKAFTVTTTYDEDDPDADIRFFVKWIRH